MRLLLYCYSVLLLSLPAIAIADPIALSAAIKALDASDLDTDWDFTMHLVSGDERRLIKSKAERSPYQRRQLLSIDGAEPEDSALAEFRKSEIKRIDEEDADAKGFIYLVDAQSLELIAREDAYSSFFFRPRIKRLASEASKMRGKLIVDNATGDIEAIEIYNTAPLSPMFSVKLESYRLQFEFSDVQGRRLLQRMESHAKGKAGFVKEIDSLVIAEFKDFAPARAD